MSTSNRDIVKNPNNSKEFKTKPVKYVSKHRSTEGIESICGSNDLQDVEKYNGQSGVSIEFVKKHQKPVGQVQWNKTLPYSNPGDVSDVRWGSGILITQDLFLTAGHLFDNNPGDWIVPRKDNSNNPIAPEEIALNMKVNFNYQINPTTNEPYIEDSYEIEKLVEYRNEGLDYAIVKLKGSPGNKYGFTKISNTDAKINDMLCIIQHPRGLPKKIGAGKVITLREEFIAYQIDTEGGTSGSAIIQSSNEVIVGVHTNGDCPDKDNYGLRISSIKEVSPTVQKLLNE
ncbi:hypothetical protein AT269_18370 [Bacillus cereus]|nr:hypothetical protein AT269_18370 [Bacillus cereus]